MSNVKTLLEEQVEYAVSLYGAFIESENDKLASLHFKRLKTTVKTLGGVYSLEEIADLYRMKKKSEMLDNYKIGKEQLYFGRYAVGVVRYLLEDEGFYTNVTMTARSDPSNIQLEAYYVDILGESRSVFVQFQSKKAYTAFDLRAIVRDAKQQARLLGAYLNA